jgi:hypothetical protein
MRGIHRGVMLEPIPADEPHQFLQLGNVHDGLPGDVRQLLLDAAIAVVEATRAVEYF